MCLEVTLEITEVNEKQLDGVTNEIEKDVDLWFCGEPGQTGQQVFSRYISEPKMCGCTLLTDAGIDWHAEFWAFKSDVLPQISHMLKELSKKASVVSFQAAWRGSDPPAESSITVTLEGLLNVLRDNRIKPQMKYRISSAA